MTGMATAAAMSIPTTYFVINEFTSPAFGDAFARGCGGRLVSTLHDSLPGDVAAFGSPKTWPLFDDAIITGRNWYYGDHAFLARGGAYRISKNAYQYIPTDEEMITATDDHFRRMCRVDVAKDWRRQGEAILVCPQSPHFLQRHTGMDDISWTATVTAEIRKYTTRPIRVRTKKTKHPIEQDLRHVWAVVCYSSAAALDAYLAGVPAFVLCPWATASKLALADLSKIDTPIYPDSRMEFLHAVASRQWTLEEIADGTAWRVLNP